MMKSKKDDSEENHRIYWIQDRGNNVRHIIHSGVDELYDHKIHKLRTLQIDLRP